MGTDGMYDFMFQEGWTRISVIFLIACILPIVS